MSYQIVAREQTLVKTAHELRTNYPVFAQKANGRIERALDLALSGFVFGTDDPDTFWVRSQDPRAKANEGYYVEIRNGQSTCQCMDFERGNKCKHIIATWIAIQAEQADAEFDAWACVAYAGAL